MKSGTITIPYKETSGMRLRIALGSGSYGDIPLHSSYDSEGVILELGPDGSRRYFVVKWEDIYRTITEAVLGGQGTTDEKE